MTQIKSLDELKGLSSAVFKGENVYNDGTEWRNSQSDSMITEVFALILIVDIKNWHYHPDDEPTQEEDADTMDNEQTKRLMDSYRRILERYDAENVDKKLKELKEVNEFLEDSE